MTGTVHYEIIGLQRTAQRKMKLENIGSRIDMRTHAAAAAHGRIAACVISNRATVTVFVTV